jgi:hypothetical protein
MVSGSSRYFRPAVEVLEDRIALTTFTMTSPTSPGLLPDTISVVGGIVLDLVGVNGRRVVSQLPATALFQGMFDNGTPTDFRGNPGTIGVQSGFTPALLNALGPGLKEVGIRLTLFDGDTAAGDFDLGDNLLLVNGLALGNFSDVATEETTEDGLTTLSSSAGGFRNDRLDTGFFYSSDEVFLAGFRASLLSSGDAVFQLQDVDAFDNFFDFTQGLASGATDVGQIPTLGNLPPEILSVTAGGPARAGNPIRETVLAVDPEAAGPLTYQFDFDNDGVFEKSNRTGVARHTFATTGDHQVAIRVLDADGAEAFATTTITVLPPEVRQPPPPLPRPPPRQSSPEQTIIIVPNLDQPRTDVTTPSSPGTGPRVPVTRPLSPRTLPTVSSLTSALTFLAMISGGGAASTTKAPPVQAPPPSLLSTASRLRGQAMNAVRSAAGLTLDGVRSLAGSVVEAVADLRAGVQRIIAAAASVPARTAGYLTPPILAVTPGSVISPPTPRWVSLRARAVVWSVLLTVTALVVQRRWAVYGRRHRHGRAQRPDRNLHEEAPET